MKANWVNHPFDKYDPRCVKCGESLFLNEGCEWSEKKELILCSACALDVIEMLMDTPRCPTDRSSNAN